MAVANGLIFLSVGTSNPQLWVSSGYGDLGGDPGDVDLQKDNTFPLSIDFGGVTSNLRTFVSANGTLFFTVDVEMETQLWTSDGTIGGTTQILTPGIALTVDDPSMGALNTHATDVDGQVFFFSTDKLYRTDGESVYEVQTIVDGEFSEITFDNLDGEVLASTTVANGSMFFTLLRTGADNDLYRTKIATDIHGQTNYVVEVLSVRNGDRFVYGPDNIFDVDGTVFFRGAAELNDNSPQNFELWRTDGTVDGTVKVSEINQNGDGIAEQPEFTNVNGTLFFKGKESNDLRLWKSDGTDAGTQLVDIRDGLGFPIELQTEARLVNHDGVLVFHGNNSDLWATNGEQHYFVGEIPQLNGAGNRTVVEYVNAQGRLFFATSKPDQVDANLFTIPGLSVSPVTPGDIQPVQINGVTHGQVQRVAVPDILSHPNYVAAPGVDLTELAAVGKAFTMELAPHTGTNSEQEWQVISGLEGFEKPVIVATVANDSPGRGGIRIRNAGGTWQIMFDEWDQRNGGGAHQSELVNIVVIEEGIHQLEDGTKIVAQFSDLTDQSTEISLLGAFKSSPAVISQLVSANRPAMEPVHQAAVSRVTLVGPESFNAQLQVEESRTWDGELQTIAWIAIEKDRGQSNGQIYETGAVLNATHQNTIINYQQDFDSAPITVVASQTFTESDPFHIRWKRDASNPDQKFVFFLQEDRSLDNENVHQPEEAAYFSFQAGAIYATADFDLIGPSYIKASPEPTTITPVTDINALGDSNPENLTDVNGIVYFTASNGLGRGDGLYRTVFDNESQSFETCRVRVTGDDCDDGGPGTGLFVNNAKNLTAVDGRLYYTVGNNLFVLTDNTHGSVQQNAFSGATNVFLNNISNLHESNGKLFFTAYYSEFTFDSIRGNELFVIDQFGATPRLVDISPGFEGSSPEQLTTSNNVLFFAAERIPGEDELDSGDATNGRKSLYKSFGNGEFFGNARDQYGAIENINPQNLTDVDGTLYFTGEEEVPGGQSTRTFLWYVHTNSDKDDIEAYRVSEVFQPDELTAVRGRLYFTSVTDAGRRLFVTDGTVSTIEEVQPNSRSEVNYLAPEQLTESNGFLFFVAEDSSTLEHAVWGLDPSDPVYMVNESGENREVDLTGAIKIERRDAPPGTISNLTDVEGTLFFYRANTDGNRLMKINDDFTGTGAPINVAGDELWWGRPGFDTGVIEEAVAKRDGSDELGVSSNSEFLSANGHLYYVGIADEIGIDGFELKVVADHLACDDLADRASFTPGAVVAQDSAEASSVILNSGLPALHSRYHSSAIPVLTIADPTHNVTTLDSGGSRIEKHVEIRSIYQVKANVHTVFDEAFALTADENAQDKVSLSDSYVEDLELDALDWIDFDSLAAAWR